MNIYKIKRIISYLLLIVSVILLISGFGITKTRIIGGLSFGLMTKQLSFTLHEKFVYIFIVLLIIHIIPLKWFLRSK